MSLTPEQIVQCRADTPACSKLIHFNNAGSSLMPTPVFDATIDHLQLEREVGGYEAATIANDALDNFYRAVAQMLKADAAEIAFIENATRAWDMAFYSLPWQEGDRVITHASEYASNYLAFLQLQKRLGIHIDVATSDSTGQIDVDAIAPLVTTKTKLIALTHVPTQGGLINPAAAVGRVAKEHGLLYLLDACQSAGQIDLDVNELGCDMLTGTGRKFLRGPRGTGFLYVRRNLIEKLEPPFIDLHSAVWTGENKYEWAPDAMRFENFESHVAGRIGLATAIDYAMALGLPAIQKRVTNLAAALRKNLQEISGVEVRDQGSKKSGQCGIVTFTKADEVAATLAARLRTNHINISYTPQNYAQLDLGSRNIEAVARASVHYYNTDDEIAQFCEILQQG